ncbi:MAG: hypothetical protein ACK5V4_05585 [Alphaproteobacteria bacterium]
MDLNLLSLIIKIGIGLKNLRFSLVFRGGDYSISDEIPDSELSLEEEFAQSKKVTYEDKSQYYTKGNRFYKKPSLKQIKAQESESEKGFITATDKWFHSLKHPKHDTGYESVDNSLNYIVGGLAKNGLVSFMNVVFSPGFGYTVAILASLALFSTPFGPGIATAAFLVSIGTVAFGVYRKVDMSMKLDKVKEERIILDEMSRVQKEIDVLIANSPELSSKLIPQHKTNDLKLKYTHAEGADFVLTEHGLSIAVNVGLSIATLNPIALLVTFFGMSTGYAGIGVMRREYQERYYHLVNHNNDIKASIGLKIDPEHQGENNKQLANKLAELRQSRDAIKSLASHGSNTFTYKDYQVALGHTPKITVPTATHSFDQSFEQFFNTSFSWASNNRLFTPFIRSTNDVQKFSEAKHENS